MDWRLGLGASGLSRGSGTLPGVARPHQGCWAPCRDPGWPGHHGPGERPVGQPGGATGTGGRVLVPGSGRRVPGGGGAPGSWAPAQRTRWFSSQGQESGRALQLASSPCFSLMLFFAGTSSLQSQLGAGPEQLGPSGRCSGRCRLDASSCLLRAQSWWGQQRRGLASGYPRPQRERPPPCSGHPRRKVPKLPQSPAHPQILATGVHCRPHGPEPLTKDHGSGRLDAGGSSRGCAVLPTQPLLGWSPRGHVGPRNFSFVVYASAVLRVNQPLRPHRHPEARPPQRGQSFPLGSGRPAPLHGCRQARTHTQPAVLGVSSLGCPPLSLGSVRFSSCLGFTAPNSQTSPLRPHSLGEKNLLTQELQF